MSGRADRVTGDDGWRDGRGHRRPADRGDVDRVALDVVGRRSARTRSRVGSFSAGPLGAEGGGLALEALDVVVCQEALHVDHVVHDLPRSFYD